MSTVDPLGDDYEIWCEVNVCPACEGVGSDYIEDDWNEATQDFGKTWVCGYCKGTGIDPAAADYQSDCDQA